MLSANGSSFAEANADTGAQHPASASNFLTENLPNGTWATGHKKMGSVE